jgi:hypothetical protein
MLRVQRGRINMNTFATRIRPFVSLEIAAAADAPGPSARFRHLERAHVLGQASTWEHVRVHAHMLAHAWRHRDSREIAGQLIRLLGAAALTGVGMVPTGNTGGADVSSLRRMAIPPDLAKLIATARQ